ncbi:hypothetical protein NUW58_g3680 [Xylaria curta]|uniref:Uncharacterized protein n=1 Tax=Xylaria curta TaxID=42375 RepID=A0ACC1P9X6_9PEZI|nr:hypothetical protein NUW58_g3680 [Xylaria curta]
MDPLVTSELSKCADDIPFSPTLHHVHSTWAKTFLSRPDLYFQPETLPEIEKIVKLAHRCHRRIATTGCGHSPSSLTCTSSWLVNLDKYNRILSLDKSTGVVVVQAGIRLYQLCDELAKHGFAMPNLGSINQQSIAGAISTGTHGSSLKHGIMSEDVLSLRITTADGVTRFCSPGEDSDLFRAAVLSLGALGIITEITFQAVPEFTLKWQQVIDTDSKMLGSWDKGLWTQAEFVRVWWYPYTRRAVVWSAEKTSEVPVDPPRSYYGGALGYYVYHNLLYVAHYVPRILPWVEWFVFGMEFGFSNGSKTQAIQPSRQALLMNCLYSQYVNEWAIPLHRGPEALRRLRSWLNQLPPTDPEYVPHNIPFSAKDLWVHAPVEVRVSDNSSATPNSRPYLDPTVEDGPTLYLNATLYRPYYHDPPSRDRYYEAFEWLMRELGGRPHWAKNFQTTGEDIEKMYGSKIQQWRKVRESVDPDGVFIGPWHRCNVLESGNILSHEEVDTGSIKVSDTAFSLHDYWVRESGALPIEYKYHSAPTISEGKTGCRVMRARQRPRRPSPPPPRLLDKMNGCYVNANAFSDKAWDAIFKNLSKLPNFNLDFLGMSDADAKTYIRRRLACLFPRSNYHYTPDQISTWESLMTSPLKVSTDDLHKIIALDFSGYPAAPHTRGFVVWSYTMSVSEQNRLFNYLNKTEQMVQELVAWDDFIAEEKLDSDGRIFIRHISSYTVNSDSIISITPLDPSGELEQNRTGALPEQPSMFAEFYSAVTIAAPDVMKTGRPYFIRNITTSTDDKKELHGLLHSILIEFFGVSAILDRHSSNTPKWFTRREEILTNLFLRSDFSAFQGLQYPSTIARSIKNHFNKMKKSVIKKVFARSVDARFEAKVSAAIDGSVYRSIPRYYGGNKVAICTKHEYRSVGEPLMVELLSSVKPEVLPFLYYFWPSPPDHRRRKRFIAYMWDYFFMVKPQVCGYHAQPYTTDVYLEEVGQPIARVAGDHHFIHVPLLHPSRGRYGIYWVDKAVCDFMQTSFWNLLLISNHVMSVLDGLKDGVLVATPRPGQNDTEVVCRMAMELFENFCATDPGIALCEEHYRDSDRLKEIVEKVPLFIPF